LTRALAWVGTAIAVWIWQAWRHVRLAREVAAVDRLAAELEGNE